MNDARESHRYDKDEAATPGPQIRLASLQAALLATGMWSWHWNPATDHLQLDHPLWRSPGGRLSLARFLAKVEPDQRRQMAQTLQRLAADILDGSPRKLAETLEFSALDDTGKGCVFSLTAVAEAAPSAHGMVTGVLRDVTASRNQQQELRETVTAANQASQKKSDFLAMMSHEIRTQLNAVIGMAEMLLSSQLEERQRMSLGIIHDAGLALSNIVNDALDLSKIEAGKLEIESRPFKVKDLVGRVVEGNFPRASAKGLALTSHVADLPPGCLVGDEHRLRQVLNNLLGNALKFTEKGSVFLESRVVGDKPDEREFMFMVRDTGMGIAKDRLPQLFQEFSQLDISVSRQFGGTGLGLAICKQLVELMDGRIGVDSEAGRGTTFWFTIPLKLATEADDGEQPNAAPARPPVSPQPIAGVAVRAGADDGMDALLAGRATAMAESGTAAAAQRRSPDPTEIDDADLSEAPLQKRPASPPGARQASLLVVDDNKMNQTVISALLLRTGYRLDVVDSGAAAIAAAESGSYDLILMDVHMPGMDGLEATRRIRAMGGTWSEIPILALTADQGEDCRKSCDAAGMNGFLNKPVDKSRVMEAVEKALTDARKEGALRAAV